MNYDTKLRKTIREVALAVERCGGPKQLGNVVQPLLDLGVTANMHVGQPIAWFDADPSGVRQMEWYAGSLLDVVKQKAWFAVNSWLNGLDKYCPEADN